MKKSDIADELHDQPGSNQVHAVIFFLKKKEREREGAREGEVSRVIRYARLRGEVLTFNREDHFAVRRGPNALTLMFHYLRYR